jgi:acyl transferase domain-containing protein
VGSAKRYSALTNGNNHFFADGNSSHRQQLTTPKVCVWSAADEVGIKNFISIYGRFFKQRAVDGNIPPLDDLTYTLAARRTAHPWRSYMVVSSEDELRSIAQSSSKPVRVPVDPRSVAFVFTGQGAAYPKMGYELLGFPRFGETISRLDNLLNELGCSWSLRDLLVDPDASISHPEYSQTATTAVQIAIVELLRSFGIVPSAVIGHSSGEVAAAYCAGAIGEAEAMAIAYHRGRLAATIPKRLSAPESMLAVGLGEDSIRPFFIRLKSAVGEVKVTIACLNSPASVTLSGDETQLDLLDQWLKEEKHFARKLPVSVAYHSASMKAIEVEYLESLSILTAKKELNHTTPMVSSVTGNIISPNSLRDPGYWVTNLVSQVKFSPALSLLTFQSGRPRRKHLGRNVQTLSGIKDFMEIGPHSTLQGPIRDVLKSMKAQSRLTYVPTLRRSRDAARSILESAAHMWTLGYPVDLLKASGIDEHSRAVLTDLPEYAFNHTKRYWSEDRVSADMRFRKYPPHELLGTWIPSSTPLEGRWRSFLDAERLPWVRDHHVSPSLPVMQVD